MEDSVLPPLPSMTVMLVEVMGTRGVVPSYLPELVVKTVFQILFVW